MSKVIKQSGLNLKGAKSILLLIALLLIGAAFLSGKSIRAQMANLYSESSDQVAGINSLMTAVANNDIDGVRFFSKAGSSIINQKNIGGATALHIAAREKNLEIAKILVENGADINATDNEGWTPLMRSALAADDAFLSFLLDKNADAAGINLVNESAIILATSAECDKCLSLLFEKFNFIKMMNNKLLSQQINDSYTIARNHENEAMQKILGDYLDRFQKMSALVDPQESSLPDAINITATPFLAPTKSSKKFKFLGSSRKKIDSIEVVEQISIENKKSINITEPVAPKEAILSPKPKKIIYKFIGSKSETQKAKELIPTQNNQILPASEVIKASEIPAQNKVFRFKKTIE
jgi:hypothetical protein